MWQKVSKIWWVLAAIFIFAADISTGGDFYYGGFSAQSVLEKCPALKDSLKFNLVFLRDLNSSNIHYLRDNSLKGVAEQVDQNSPTWWTCHSKYTLWEAEGFPESGKGFTFDGGTQVCDPQAHPYPCSGTGWNTMRFCNPADSGVVQTGPDYKQYGLGPNDPYHVDFNLKFSGNRSVPNKPVCKIMVVVDSSTVVESTLVVSVFPINGYQKFQLQYSLSDSKNTQFKIRWFGVDSLYVDYVEVGNQYGYDLMGRVHDQEILNYVQQGWVDTSVVYRWYNMDQPQSIDCYMPLAYIDTLLKTNLPYKPGAVFTCYFGDTNSIHEYLVRTDPIEYMVDAYSFSACDTGSNIQQSLNWLTDNYSYNKKKAVSMSKDFWLAIQAHAVGYRKTSPSCDSGRTQYEYPPNSGTYYCLTLKDPLPNDVRVQTFLAMCYGADAVMNYRTSYLCDGDYLETGLYDQYADSVTDKWKEIENFTGPRAEELGPIINALTWQGAGESHNISSISGSFIDTVKSAEFDSAWVEAGFFKDASNTNYFMLVNRRCLSTEAQNITISIDSFKTGNEKKMWYVIDQYSHDTTFTGAINGLIPFTTHLEPGEGKLFKLTPFSGSAFHGTAHPLTWQGGIMIDGDVTVAFGANLKIETPAKIAFIANKDTLHTWDPTSGDLIIQGGLRAIGTETDSIIFTSTGTTPGDWEGIYIDTMASSDAKMLSHCIVEYSYAGVRLLDKNYWNPDTIKNCRFSFNEMYAVYSENYRAMIINNSIFQDPNGTVPHGIYLKNINTGTAPRARGNTLRDCARAINVESCSTLVTENYICGDHPDAYGFRCYNCNQVNVEGTNVCGDSILWGFYNQYSKVDISGCAVQPNTGHIVQNGILFNYGSQSSLRRTLVKNFSNRGVSCLHTVPDLGTEISHGINKIYSTDVSALYVYASSTSKGDPTDSVSALYNWWGTYPPSSSRFSGKVKYMPALESEPWWPDPQNEKIAILDEIPKDIELYHNYPNPFNPATTIQFTISSNVSHAYATLKIYNILGQLVKTLVDEEKSEGTYTIFWDGRNDDGETVSSGVYFYRLQAGELTEVKKMVLLH